MTACRKLKQLRREALRQQNVSPEWLDAPFANLADEYLTDIKTRRASGTYRNYREQLLRAIPAESAAGCR